MRRLTTILAALALVSLTIVFAVLGTAGGDSSPSSPHGRSSAPSTSTLPRPLSGPSTFTTGIADSVYFQSKGRNTWLTRTVAAGARFVLLWVNWPSMSPQPPPAGTDPADPGNPAYHWGSLDATVRAATAHGLDVVLSVTHAPAWADGPDKPAHVPSSAWRPNVAAFAAFAHAVARRYSGSFNPGTGVLPRVRYFQAWTEPNFAYNLSPQWARVRGRPVPESPIIYRGLLNAFYGAVKAVHPSNLVLTAGSASYGKGAGRGPMRPGLFVRELLCLRGHSLMPEPCPDPAHFDILAQDPYSFRGPLVPAYWPDDVSVADVWKLTRTVTAAERTGRALPRVRHPTWVTEFGWVSAANRDALPPRTRRYSLPPLKRARWIEQGFFELWRQRVSTATWFLIADPPSSSFWQTGLYYRDGRRKPGFEAFRFPFLVYGSGPGWAKVWAVSPDSGTVRVQAREAGRWRTLLRARVRARGVISRTIAVSGHPLLRAVIGSDTSLGWRA